MPVGPFPARRLLWISAGARARNGLGPERSRQEGSGVNQRTIAEKISCTGIGLHTGEPVLLTLGPARAGSGIFFVRTDLAHPVEIPAREDEAYIRPPFQEQAIVPQLY